MINTELRCGNVKPLTYRDPADRQLVWALGSLNPSIAAFPHRIVENTFENLTEWCKVLGAKAAPWQLQPAFDFNGEGLDGDDYTPERLRLWETSENEALLPVMMNADLEFPLLVDTQTNPKILQMMWDHPVRDYYSYMEHLALWIDSLGWAYLPLEYENEFALLVASRGGSEWVNEADRRLASQHKTIFRLLPGNGRVHWNGPTQF